MKNIINKIKFLLYAFFMITFTIDTTAQVVSSDICTSLGDNAAISLRDASGNPLTSVKSGLDFNLILDVPGGLCQGGSYDVTITTSDNLVLGNQNPNYPFYNSGTNQFKNASVISSNNGLGINIPFKFKAGVTCNGEKGTFNVKITLTCLDGSVRACIFKQISLNAIAQNYWKVEKKHVWGNLRGGTIIWDIILTNTNPNPGIGDYNILNPSIQDAFPNAATGTIVSVVHYSGGGSLIGLTGLNSSMATWNTGLILSSNGGAVVYRVTTNSCMPAGTLIKNCINIFGSLGKIQYPLPSCAFINNATPICDTVRLVGTATSSANFSKSLTYPVNVLNYAPGCEAEYTISVSNNGNIPLNNIIISDLFPTGLTGIDVTQISVSSGGTNMDYTTNLQSGTFNSSVNQSWPPNLASPPPPFTSFNLTTTNGMLLGGSVVIKIRFKINAIAGTIINNCADLNYNGTYGGTSSGGMICGVIVPPLPATSTLHSCAPFTVQQPAAIPGIRKCIRNGQQSFSVGDVIPFRIVISNHGGANFSGNLTDLLGLPQNLALISGSLTYSYGVGSFSPYSTTPGCMTDFSNISNTLPSWVSVTQQTTQNLGWSINGMPANCELDQASYLIIDFDATILPHPFGQYCNRAKLGTLFSDACYNVMRVAQISTKKQVSTAFVEPGQSFNYIIVVKNEGSVALKNILVKDALPSCVTYTNRSGRILDVNGNLVSSVNVTGGPPIFTLSTALILQPGQSVELTITVLRKANDQSAQCCNLSARGSGTTNDAASQTISDVDGPVCVESGLCCDIPDMEVDFWTNNINGEIVPAFWIKSGPLPVQEIEISLMDYHAEYSNQNCKPLNMGNLFGHIEPFVGSHGPANWNFNSLPGIVPSIPPVLALQTLISPVNNSLTWSGPTPINLSGAYNPNGIVGLNFVAPDIVNLDCCSGKVYYCFKVRVKDVNCNVCEKIVCGSSEIPKQKQIHWSSEKAKDQYRIQSLENNSNPQQKNKIGEGLFQYPNKKK